MKFHEINILLLPLALALLLSSASCSGSGEKEPAGSDTGGSKAEGVFTTVDSASAAEPVTEALPRNVIPAQYVIGTISAKDGLDSTSNTACLYNPAYIPIADAEGVVVGEGYQLTWLAYGASKNYLGNGNNYYDLWQPDGSPIIVFAILKAYPEAAYFRYAVKNVKEADANMSDVEKSGVTLLPAGSAISAKIKESFSYTGKGISEKKTVTLSGQPSIPAGQDGAVYGSLLFRFGNRGTGQVISLPDCTVIGSIAMDHTDEICPHGNSVSFGTAFYLPEDKFPLLYSNVYNNYSSASDRREGYCCVYRITEDEMNYQASLVQVIRIGFVNDLSLWSSKPDFSDVRPYGNFVADGKNNTLWAFVMRDADKLTRVFSFDLPAPDAGVIGADPSIPDIPVVTLDKEDIKTQFDGGYSHYVQGATVSDDLLYSLEGFTNSSSSPAGLRVFDTKSGCEVAFINLYGNGFGTEPELISVFGSTLYYSDCNGKFFSIEFS